MKRISSIVRPSSAPASCKNSLNLGSASFFLCIAYVQLFLEESSMKMILYRWPCLDGGEMGPLTSLWIMANFWLDLDVASFGKGFFFILLVMHDSHVRRSEGLFGLARVTPLMRLLLIAVVRVLMGVCPSRSCRS